MVNRCFRHQHPEAYGPWAPAREPRSAELRPVMACDVWVPFLTAGQQYLPEEPMGLSTEGTPDP